MTNISEELLNDRIVFFVGEVDDQSCADIIQRLLYLNKKDQKRPIHLYIMSPGGSVVAGLAVIDTIKLITAPVYTYCLGQTASMGAVLLSAGEKGHRYITQNSEVMIHQISWGVKGKNEDIQVVAEVSRRKNKLLFQMLADNCNKPIAKIYNDCRNDYYMSAEHAIEYGIADKILGKEEAE